MEINKLNRKRKGLITLLMALGIAVTVGVVATKGFLRSIENMAEDNMYQSAGIIPNNIKIIAIDEKTLLRLGSYSDWNRSYFADLIDILNVSEDTSPNIIGMDIVFSGTNGEKEDIRLAEAAKRYGNLILASTVTFDSYVYKDVDKTYYTTQYVSGEGTPYDELAAVADYGFTNAIFDEDGFVRRTYTSIFSEYKGEKKVYDSFAYLIASKSGNVKNYPSQVEIAFTGNPGDFEKISMADVLDGTVPAEYFDDCIVLVGAFEEGMMDAYRVPVDYSKEMYGVELQANYIYAFLNDRIIYSTSSHIQFFIIVVIVALFAYYALNSRMRDGIIGMFAVITSYILIAIMVFRVSSYKLNLLAVPVGVILALLATVLYKYITMQKKRVLEMREMLFSMAEAMAEAIEGRTPYNANHTKNVAKRCIEMLDFINKKHREKKTALHFSQGDKQQLYLAAMLHDVGKMDVPLRIMDKPTKLGSREKELKDRLEIISLRIENDALCGYLTKEEADAKLAKIHTFTENLGAFNCGRPLKEEEWAIINEIAESVYVAREGEKIPYLTQEEIDDLYIKAGTLSDKERTIMQSHVVYTDKILAHMQFGEQFKNVRTMASNHHELLNGKGYPKGIKEEEIDTMTRILTIMDIYDSLIADDRPYKKPKSVKVAFEILNEEAEAGKVDKEILQFAKELYLNEEE